MYFPSGLNTTLFTQPSCFRTKICLPVAASHIRAVLSLLAVAMYFPSGLKTTLFTGPSWFRTKICLPVVIPYTCCLSSLAVATYFPSGLKTTSFTEPSWFRSKICLPVDLHILLFFITRRSDVFSIRTEHNIIYLPSCFRTKFVYL